MARLKAAGRVERRTAFAGANLTIRERAEIERRAVMSGRRLSDFIRETLLSNRPGAAIEPRLPPEIGCKLAFELVRIGTNLNQLAYHANVTRSMPARDALDATLDEIVKATEVLTRL